MPDSDSDLRQLVQRYQVTWETRPEMASSGHSVVPVGYVIELNAVPDHPEHAEQIACPDCAKVEDALERLTRTIAPTEVLDVARGTRALGNSHDARPEVTATVTVVHNEGGGTDRAPGEDEQRRVAALVERLRALGAQERHWNDHGSTSATA